MPTEKLILFAVVSGIMLLVSRESLRHPTFHGFYRFFAWELILVLILYNMEFWFHEPGSILQILSWNLLFISLFLVIHGVTLLRVLGKPDASRKDVALIRLEKTTRLVTAGAYHYIRHPLYSSLMFLAWGAYFKRPSWPAAGLAAGACLFLVATSRMEEKENLRYFGDEYMEYMKRTRMFIPFLF